MRFTTPILLLFTITACAGEPVPDEGAVQPAEVAAAPGDSAFRSDTPEDSTIFVQTMEWAREQRLDTLNSTGAIAAAIGRRFVGAPYTPGTLEAPGPESLVVNLREFDCVTYVESMLAFARVVQSNYAGYGQFKNELRTIRYRTNAALDYPLRLHYFSDWIATNAERGVVENITQQLGGTQDSEPINFMSTHRASYRQLADTANYQAIEQLERELSGRPRYYIPENRIGAVAQDIQDGDVIAATSTVGGLDIAHTGLALWVNGQLHMMHAPLVGRSVEISEKPLAERIFEIEGQDGIMVARPQPPR